jgi:molybdenum-dependent DNA-binding transcriptional regulator ModE
MLTGVCWAQLLWGTAALADGLAKASLDATNLDVEFSQAHYGIRCARLRASVPRSELIAEGTELRTLVGDEEFFAAHAYRTTRFHVGVPECRVLGLAYSELLQGKSYRAKSVHFSRLTFDALVNRDKPVGPFVKSPLMVHEALAVIRQPLQVDSLSITNGHFRYCERLAVGADPAVLTFGAVSLSVEGIANRGEATAAIQLRGQGDLMEAGTLKVLMSIPITPSNFSLHYSGSLSAMDLTRLDAFLDIAEHTRIKSGSVQEAAFEIEVSAGQARGRVRAIYKDLEIAVLGKQTGTEKRLGNRVASFLANLLKVRSSNAPDASGAMKEGEVNYARRPDEEFQQFAWFALRTGVLDIISH